MRAASLENVMHTVRIVTQRTAPQTSGYIIASS